MWVRLLQGTPPSVHTAIELYNVLSMSDTASLRQPVGLEQQLLKDNDMDSEVGQSMLQLLKVMSVTATLLLQAYQIRTDCSDSHAADRPYSQNHPTLQDVHSASLHSRHPPRPVSSYSNVEMPSPCCLILLQPSRKHNAFVKHCALPGLWSTCTRPYHHQVLKCPGVLHSRAHAATCLCPIPYSI